MKRFYLIGFKCDNIWERPDIYSRTKDGILIEADDWDKAMSFADKEKAELKRKWLQENYPENAWYLIER